VFLIWNNFSSDVESNGISVTIERKLLQTLTIASQVRS
jgi:hypothetical protein